MTERPILFNAPMVRAILSDKKTQTRRIMKPQIGRVHVPDIGPLPAVKKRHGDGWWLWPNARENVLAECPLGQPGDLIWVREAWRVIDRADSFAPRELLATDRRIWFEADGAPAPPAGRYRPGMFMPRWVSRITLEITGVRIERLQDISEADAVAEGAEPILVPPDGGSHPYREGFRDLWDGLNAKRGAGWDVSPWVWAIEFKRLENEQ